jgi:hypothetical protein
MQLKREKKRRKQKKTACQGKPISKTLMQGSHRGKLFLGRAITRTGGSMFRSILRAAAAIVNRFCNAFLVLPRRVSPPL